LEADIGYLAIDCNNTHLTESYYASKGGKCELNSPLK